MSSDSFYRSDVFHRLDVFEELSEKFKKEMNGYKESIDRLNKEVVELKSTIESKNKEIIGFKEDRLSKNRDVTLLQGASDSLKSKVNKVNADNALMKKELIELRKYNPKKIKKNLDDKKKELKNKNTLLDELMKKSNEDKKDKQIYIKTIKSLKEKILIHQKQSEGVEDFYLYTSLCGNFKVFAASFESKVRPFLGKDLNYRVIDLRDGTSLVALRKDDEICFGIQEKIPKDISEFIHAVVTFGEDE
jgi:hypothetical protein